MIDGGFAVLGLTIASLIARSLSHTAVAAGLGDAGGILDSLRSVFGSKPESVQDLGKRIARRLDAAVTAKYKYADPADRSEAAEVVAGLLNGETVGVETLVVEAVSDTDRFTRRVMEAGGSEARASLPEGLRRSIFDGMLKLAAETIRQVVHGSEAFQFVATQRQLGQLATISDDTNWIRDFIAAQAGTASREEVAAYLRARIEDWDRSIWHPGQQAPSSVERRLRVRISGNTGSPAVEGLSETEALLGQRVLVVLGGPGSGKTWLARRYAREAARAALAQLEAGIDLGQVELPLMTTWDLWSKTSGETRHSLVEAAFVAASGVSDVGSGEALARMRRTLTRPGQRVLAVVDSLDEAADTLQQGSRLSSLVSLQGWRVVISSRPAAWDATWRGQNDVAEDARVVELQDLGYPEDVNAFICAWFSDDLKRSDALAAQIKDREHLRRAAVIPLFLTFYCLLAEEAEEGGVPLPAFRREMYRRLVRRLLRGKWSENAPGPDAAPDPLACETLLTRWALNAVRDGDTHSGLSMWGDSFVQPSFNRVSLSQSRALDHVAPKLSEDDEGRVTRRFVHRTVLEHFVAEYVASLDPDPAAEVLFPHLWFDPDWSFAAPAAIAAHNQEARGALFELLVRSTTRMTPDPAKEEAAREFDRLLLAIAEQSHPDEWTVEHRPVLDECRVRNALTQPAAVVRSAHWASSNPAVRASVLTALSTARPWAVAGLVAVLSDLQATDMDLERACSAVLGAVKAADPRVIRDLVAVLPAVAVTDVDRARARSGVLGAVGIVEPVEVCDLVAVLPDLTVSDIDRARARSEVLDAMEAADPRVVQSLAAVLPDLVIDDVERQQALEAVLRALGTARAQAVSAVASVLPKLVVNDVDRARARSVVLSALATAEPWDIQDLVAVLPDLDATDDDREQALELLLNALKTAGPSAIRGVETLLGGVAMTERDRKVARLAILSASATSNPFTVRDLVTLLHRLEPTDDDRQQALAAMLDAVAAAPNFPVRGLPALLPGLVVTDRDRRQALGAVLDAVASAPKRTGRGLATSELSAFSEFAAVLPRLVATDVERKQALAAVLRALGTVRGRAVSALVAVLPKLVVTADPSAIRGLLAMLPNSLAFADRAAARDLAAALRRLELTAVERERALEGLLGTLATARSTAVPGLVAVLSGLVVTAVEREQVLEGALGALATAHSAAVPPLVAVLPSLVVTDPERHLALVRVLDAIETAAPSAVGGLVAVLPALTVTDNDRERAFMAVLSALSDAHPFAVSDLLAVLSGLVVTDGDREQARAAVLGALVTAHPFAVRDLLVLLPGLMATVGDRTQACSAVVDALKTADPSAVRDLAAVLPGLAVTEADRERARVGVLAALFTAEPWAGRSLVAVLPGLVVTDVDRKRALAAALAALRTAPMWAVSPLAALLPSLVMTDADREHARAGILSAVETADPGAVPGLVALLPDLTVTDVDRPRSLASVLGALAVARPSAVRPLVGLLPDLLLTEVDREQARAGVLAALPSVNIGDVHFLVRQLRQLSTIQEWLDWL